MSKLSKEELLYWLALARWYHPPSDQKERKSKQAYEQIKEIVKLHFSDDWQQVKKDLGKFMQGKKLQVTEEWIEEKAVEIYNLSYYKSFHPKQIAECIRSLVEKIK